MQWPTPVQRVRDEKDLQLIPESNQPVPSWAGCGFVGVLELLQYHTPSRSNLSVPLCAILLGSPQASCPMTEQSLTPSISASEQALITHQPKPTPGKEPQSPAKI